MLRCRTFDKFRFYGFGAGHISILSLSSKKPIVVDADVRG